jgi:hypothetical protein
MTCGIENPICLARDGASSGFQGVDTIIAMQPWLTWPNNGLQATLLRGAPQRG